MISLFKKKNRRGKESNQLDVNGNFDNNNLKVAIIGCGKMATNHLDKVVKLISRKNIGLCDKELIKAQLLGELYGIDNTFDSLDELINYFDADIYHIVTPPASHKQVAIKCMRGGGHVYIEKPVCLTVQEFSELEDVASQCNKLICAGHQRLFESQYKNIKRRIQSGEFGKIIHIHGYDSGPYLFMEDQGLSRGWWHEFTGGMYLDLLPHLIGVFNDLIDGLNLEHSSICTDARNRPTDLHAFYKSLKTSATASLHISFSTKIFQNYFKIECEKGIILLNLRNKFYYAIKRSRLPEIIHRLLINYAVALKVSWGNSRSICSLLAGKYDPYEGTGILIRDFYHAIIKHRDSPTCLNNVRSIVHLCEHTINTSFKSTQNALDTKQLIDITNSRSSNHADVLVTGATGFIGTHLVRRLLQEGKTVRVVTRRMINENYFGKGFKHPPQVYIGNMLDASFVDDACRGVDSVYHLAAATRGDLFFQVENTCISTKNLLKAIKSNNVSKLIYVSSVSVLDQTKYPKKGIIDRNFPYESYPLKRGAYTYAKLRAEQMVRSFQKEQNVNTVIIRPGIVWGPGSEQMLLETNFRIGRLLIVLGSGKKRLPLIYVENLIDALMRAGATNVDIEPLNIVDSENPSQKEYLKMVKAITGERFLSVFIPIPFILPFVFVAERVLGFMLRKHLSISYQFMSKNNRSIYSITEAQSSLGWKSRISFFEGLKNYYNWLSLKRCEENASIVRLFKP